MANLLTNFLFAALHFFHLFFISVKVRCSTPKAFMAFAISFQTRLLVLAELADPLADKYLKFLLANLTKRVISSSVKLFFLGFRSAYCGLASAIFVGTRLNDSWLPELFKKARGKRAITQVTPGERLLSLLRKNKNSIWINKSKMAGKTPDKQKKINLRSPKVDLPRQARKKSSAHCSAAANIHTISQNHPNASQKPIKQNITLPFTIHETKEHLRRFSEILPAPDATTRRWHARKSRKWTCIVHERRDELTRPCF